MITVEKIKELLKVKSRSEVAKLLRVSTPTLDRALIKSGIGKVGKKGRSGRKAKIIIKNN